MSKRLAELKPEICELYFVTGSVGTEGPYNLSVHKDNPNHPQPRSPYYMKYPKIEKLRRQPAARLQSLFDLVGEAFFEIREDLKLGKPPHRLGPIPTGAVLLGEAFARHYDPSLEIVERFEKIEKKGQPTSFVGPDRVVELGEELETLDDHTSSAFLHRRFIAHARGRGFVVQRAFSAVDRQQGAKANLVEVGVQFYSILLADELLQHGLDQSHITMAKFEEIQEYRTNNPL